MNQPMVTIEKIKEIKPHPNADRLELAYVKGWQVCVQKDIYKEGEFVLYFAIDSILPQEIEGKIFGEDAKVKLSKSRVRTIKLRKAYSQGLITPIELFSNLIKIFKEGDDVSEMLGVTKFEPVLNKSNVTYIKDRPKKKHENPNFKKVRKPNNIKNHLEEFIGKEVIITEKVHGTSFVAGWVKKPTDNIFDKINAFLFGKYEFCYRSMNVQLQKRFTFIHLLLEKLGIYKSTYYGKNLYAEICRKYDLKNRIPKEYEITGEIYGDGIQKGYSYGCKPNERKLVVFGVRRDGENINVFDAFTKTKIDMLLDYVPVLFRGILTKEMLNECTNGKSILDKNTAVREGCVVELVDNEQQWFGHPILKSISEKYLMKDNTDFH